MALAQDLKWDILLLRYFVVASRAFEPWWNGVLQEIIKDDIQNKDLSWHLKGLVPYSSYAL